ncbi:MAG: hypothetical protein ABIK09_13765 [Pseudomonadota bacterium]
MKTAGFSFLVALVMALSGAACDGGGGGGGNGGGDDTLPEDGSGGELIEDSGGGGGPQWAAVPGATLGDVTQVRGFDAAAGALYLTVTSPVSAGLFHLDLAGGAEEFAKIFEGTGLALATEAGTYMALWESKAGSLVQVNLEGEAADLSFNFPQREIQRMVYTDGLLYLLSKNWEVAEYHVNRGSAAAMQWDQLGAASNETALGFHSDGDTVAIVTVRNDIPLGLNCRSIAANATEADAWSDCPDFPQHLGAGPNDPYSVKASVTGDGEIMAAWFEILKTGQKSYEVQAGTIGGGWSVVAGLPDGVAPSAMLVAGSTLYVAYQGRGGGEQVFTHTTVSGVGGTPGVTGIGGGLPEPSGDKSGVVGLAADGASVYALYQDYNAGGSTLTAYKMIGE